MTFPRFIYIYKFDDSQHTQTHTWGSNLSFYYWLFLLFEMVHKNSHTKRNFRMKSNTSNFFLCALPATISFNKKKYGLLYLSLSLYVFFCVQIGFFSFFTSLSCKQRVNSFSNYSHLFTEDDLLTMTEYYQERQSEWRRQNKNTLPNVNYNVRPINYHSNYTSQLNERNVRERLGSLFSVRRSINMWISIDVLKRLSKGDTFRFA